MLAAIQVEVKPQTPSHGMLSYMGIIVQFNVASQFQQENCQSLEAVPKQSARYRPVRKRNRALWCHSPPQLLVV